MFPILLFTDLLFSVLLFYVLLIPVLLFLSSCSISSCSLSSCSLSSCYMSSFYLSSCSCIPVTCPPECQLNVFLLYSILIILLRSFRKINREKPAKQRRHDIQYCIILTCLARILKTFFSVFSVFFAPYHFVSHTKYSVSL